MSQQQPAERPLEQKWRLEINTIHEVLVSKCQNRATTAATTKLCRQHNNTLDNLHIKRLLMLQLRRHVSTSPTHLRCKSDPSPSSASNQTRTRVVPKVLPNPRAAPPDSDIATLWSEVHAHVSTMSDPTATSQVPSVTGTQVSDSNSQLESTLESFKVELEHELHPQLCTLVSLIEAPSVSRKLAKQIKTGANASAYMVALNLTFFQPPEMPEKITHDLFNGMNAPSVEQIVLDFQCFSDDNPRIAGILFVLAADDTWNNKFPLEYPSLLQGAGLWTPESTCSDFHAVIGSSEASYKSESLRKMWGDRAKKALTKQLSIRRADANEDKWEILTHTILRISHHWYAS